MTDPIHIKASSTRVGLTPNAIFRLWRAAVKDDERLLDEAIAAVHDQMMSSDRARAEHVISLIIRRIAMPNARLRPCSMPTGGADGPHL
jgi:hypothetical protein